MKVYQFMIGLVLMALVLAAFSVTFASEGGLADKYNITIESEFISHYNTNSEMLEQMNEITSLSVNMSDTGMEAKQLEDDYSDPVKALINTLKMVWGGFDMFKGFILGIGEVLHLPPILIIGGITILLLSVLFAILSAIFRYKV